MAAGRHRAPRTSLSLRLSSLFKPVRREAQQQPGERQDAEALLRLLEA